MTPVVHDELRRLARHFLSAERPDHTLQPTALVHEAYLRLVDQHAVDWQNRAHFLGVAASMMRRILINHARANKAAKREGFTKAVALEDCKQSVRSSRAAIEQWTRVADRDRGWSTIVELADTHAELGETYESFAPKNRGLWQNAAAEFEQARSLYAGERESGILPSALHSKITEYGDAAERCRAAARAN